ncbi:MAG: hypothetical protein BIFFINMI_00779 [Phycisphaerae bacterium]|nr:hypothetical protein [Phycisphaerae bacterium]
MKHITKATVAILLLAVPLRADDGVLTLTGFEKADAIKLGAREEPDGALGWQAGQYRKYSFLGGDVTEGSLAYVAKVSAQYLRDPHQQYRVIRINTTFMTFGWFDKIMPRDWSAYDRFRVDVKSATGGVIRVELEDDICQPAMRRQYDLPNGKWVTLEFDLADAARELRILQPDGTALVGRQFNPARMANIYIYFIRLDADGELRIDNLRLLKPGASDGGKLDLLQDKSPFPRPVALPDSTPTPRKPPADFTPAAGPVAPGQAGTLEAARLGKTGYDRLSGIASRALVAPDKDHLLLGFLAGYVHVLDSSDGGATWAGLDGQAAPTRCYHDANAPSHCAVGDGNDLFYAYTAACAGGGSPSNMFFRRAAFDGKGWMLGPPRLLDVDCRHCPENRVRILPLPDGRIWTVWMNDGRDNKLWLRGRYSDDAGATWRDPDSNALMPIDRDDSQGPQRLGVTLWTGKGDDLQPAPDQAAGRIDSYYSAGSFELARYGDQPACLYTNTWHPKAVWRVFDGKRWGEPKPIGQGFPRSAVTLGDRTIFLVFGGNRAGMGKVLRLDGEKWVEDGPSDPAAGDGGVLSVGGDRVLCFWTRVDGQKVSLWWSMRSAEGQWSAPACLAEETLPDKKPRLGIAVPPVAPRDFVPLAWGPPQDWIKFIRLPLK